MGATSRSGAERLAPSWRDATFALTAELSPALDAETRARLVEVAADAGAPGPDDAMRIEWTLTPLGARAGGMTLFAPARGADRGALAGELGARLLPSEDARALRQSLSLAARVGARVHVGVATDDEGAARVKLWLTGRDALTPLVRELGAPDGPALVALGADFGPGGLRRVRTYHRSPAPAPGLPTCPPLSTFGAPEDAHVILTRPAAPDPLGKVATWSAIFPPGRALDPVLAVAAPALRERAASLAERVAPFALRPSAVQRDYGADGRERTEVLVTLSTVSDGGDHS